MTVLNRGFARKCLPNGVRRLGPFRALPGSVTASHVIAAAACSFSESATLSYPRPSADIPSDSQEDFGRTFRSELQGNDSHSSLTQNRDEPSNRESKGQASRVSQHGALEPSLPVAPTGAQAKRQGSSQEIAVGASGASNGPKKPIKTSSNEDTQPAASQSDTVQLSSGGHEALVNVSEQAFRGTTDSSETGSKQPIPAEACASETDAVQATDSSGPVTGSLAVAMRIDATNSGDAAEKNLSADAEPGVVSNVLGLESQTPLVTAVESAERRESHSPDVSTAFSDSSSELAPQASKPLPMEAVSATQPGDFQTELEKFRAEPVRGAHVQIAGADNQRLDIRMQERGGTLSVTLRSSDADITRALQEHAPELGTRLSAEHFRTELWTPGSSKSSHQSGLDSRGNGSSGQGGSDQRENRKNKQQPGWVDEFEAHPTAFQKRINYTWPQ